MRYFPVPAGQRSSGRLGDVIRIRLPGGKRASFGARCVLGTRGGGKASRRLQPRPISVPSSTPFDFWGKCAGGRGTASPALWGTTNLLGTDEASSVEPLRPEARRLPMSLLPPIHKQGAPERAPGRHSRCRIRTSNIHSAHQGTAHERSPASIADPASPSRLSGRCVSTRGGSSRCAAVPPRRGRPPPAPARRRRRRSSARSPGRAPGCPPHA